MRNFFQDLSDHVKRYRPSIVFPEGLDKRVLTAGCRLSTEKVLKPIFIGDERAILKKIEELNLVHDGIEIINPTTFGNLEKYVETFVELQKGKVSFEEAHKMLLERNYFAAMLVHCNKAQGLVSGAEYATKDVILPAIKIIKMRRGIEKISSVFILVKGDKKLLFSDCAINIAPNSKELANIAILASEAAYAFSIIPKVALLSFSTKGSAISEETLKVLGASKIIKEQRPDLLIDGELQFDAAFVPEVAKKKAPLSPIEGEANVFIFPNLDAGNIGYKIAQRLGGYQAIGPIILGLNKPSNDLSRGCTIEEIYNVAIITAIQSIYYNM
ncbi:phosphate acetyltransferase [Halalkalibacter krulwichiae]|uniref:phosphate acetyltransferase n=1 Tax=Halalkalibacter krulwichiae TaxID=199441 RepID=UPI0008247C1A|nr:phosphate acetyltransferase [Halalkalibacter krulwichiae]